MPEPVAFDGVMNDADNHYDEPDDCFTRHIEPDFKARTVWHDRKDSEAPARLFIGDERCNFFSVATGDNVGAPGMMKESLRGTTDEGGSPSLNAIRATDVPEFVNREARLVRMDEQGVQKTLMLPTAGVGIETRLARPEHREALYPSVRAFNRWLEDDWGYGSDERIYGAPMISLVDLQLGIAELERITARGARFVSLMAGPIDGRSPGEPVFDPFWARCQEAGVNVVFHIGSTSVQPASNQAWGLRPVPPSHRNSMMEYLLSFTERPVVDTLIADNAFGRFPELRVLSVEYGSSWVDPLLTKLHHVSRLTSKDLWRFGAPPEGPVDIFRKHVFVSPFFEDDVVDLVGRIGASQVLMGSDDPHPEGLAEPREFLEELVGLGTADVEQIMRSNFERLVA